MRRWFTTLVRRSPAVAYCVLVFGLLGALFIIVRWLAPQFPATLALFIGSWLPDVAGVAVIAVAEGRPGLRCLFRRLGLWRFGVGWYAAALALPAASVLLAIECYTLAGNPAPSAIPANMLVTNALFNLILGPLGEELGWRGTLLPRVRASLNVAASGVVVGLIWFPFHLPAWLISGMPQVGMPVLAFALSTIAFSIFLAWLFDHTGGSLLITCLAHWAINFTGSSSGIYAVPAILWLWTAVWWVLVAAIVVFDRRHLVHPLALRRQS